MSQMEQVDAFGRTIPGRTSDEGRRDERSDSRGRRPRFSGGGDGWRGGGNHRGGFRGSYNDDRRHYHERDRGYDRGRPFEEPPPPPPRDFLPPTEPFYAPERAPPKTQPLLSFKSFIASQPEDHPPEVFQKMYEQYNIDYLGYFSESFFKASMGEEWFQDRYNPINIVAIEKESATWAVEESARFKQKIEEQAIDFVKACSLEPNNRSRESEAANEEVVLSGKHLPGHENRAIYVSAIHACCPKAVLKAAIINALTNNGADESFKPDRIVIAQPVWSSRALDRFERTAWIIMPSSSLARQALNILKDLEVKVPGVPEPSTGKVETAFRFKIQTTMHSPRSAPTAPDFVSSSGKIRSDIFRAMHLASLLDEDRDIPKEQRLHEIFSLQSVVDAIRKPTDHLDVAIAYLRRVHFVSFYSGKRYRDESHLLAMAPSVVYRNRAYTPAPHESQVYSISELMSEFNTEGNSASAEEMEEEGDRMEDTTHQVEKADDDDKHNGNEEEAKNELVETSEADRSMTVSEANKSTEGLGSAQKPPPPPSTSSPKGIRFKGVSVHDRKIGPIIADLHQKLSIKKARMTDPNLPGSLDEEDAKRLEQIQEETLITLINKDCKFEPDDKCRCCYNYCNKLFRGMNFLSKHLKTKHPEFSFEAFLTDAEPFMRKRYEAEDMSARPLPPVEMENNGMIELRSVKTIMEKYITPLLPPPPVPPMLGGMPMMMTGPIPPTFPPPVPPGPPPRDFHHTNDRGNNRRMSWHSNRDDDYDRDFHRGNNRKRSRQYSEDDPSSHGPVENTTFTVSNTSGNNNSSSAAGNGDRRSSYPPMGKGKGLNPYLDVDAPKESIVDVDYGVSVLPMLKKRKLGLKTTPAKASGASEKKEQSMTEDVVKMDTAEKKE